MKKLFTFFLVAVFCISPAFVLFGCEEEDFWKTTYSAVSEFCNDEKYAFITNETDLTQSYTEEVQQQISSGTGQYYSLSETYNFLSIQSLKMFITYKDSLQVAPVYLNNKKTSEIKKYFTEMTVKIYW